MKQPPEAPAAAESDPVAVASAIALRRLGRLPQTEQQLRDYLTGKRVPVEAVDIVIARLLQARLLDDAVYADMFIRSRRRSRQAGDAVIRRELRERGVLADVIAAAFEAEPADQRELAAALAERRWHSLASVEQTARIRRTVNFLIRRGHQPSTAFSVVRELADADSGTLEA